MKGKSEEEIREILRAKGGESRMIKKGYLITDESKTRMVGKEMTEEEGG